ncbi:MAG: hypothetical protein WC050_03450 [Candidatus Paceibacterota bacterium]
MTAAMRRSTSGSREILRHAENFRGSTMIVASSDIGPFDRGDLELFLQDVVLLSRLGIQFVLADVGASGFWDNLGKPDYLEVLNVSGTKELVESAVSCKATKLCLVAGTDRITTSKGHPLDDVPVADLERLLADDSLTTPGSRHALSCAVAACRAGVPRVHVVNVHRDGALLDELFTDIGAGTMFYAGLPHKEVRTMVRDDRFSVCSLLRTAIPRRTLEFVTDHQSELRVFTVDSDVHGAARVMRRNEMLLVQTLAHSERSNAAEVLESLLRFIIDEARLLGMSTVAIPADEIPALMRILPWFTGLEFKKGRMTLGVSQNDIWLKQVA